MRTAFLSLLISLHCLIGTTQIIQEGLAREINSDKQPLEGVDVAFDDAPATQTNEEGIFKLYVQFGKVGDDIYLDHIRKKGYELVNQKDLELTQITATHRMEADVILAKTNYVATVQQAYYEAADQLLISSFKQQKEQITASSTNTPSTLNKELQALQTAYDHQKAALGPLSARLAQVNFDDAEPVYRTALTLFKEGKTTSSLSTLEHAALMSQAHEKLKGKYTLVEGILQANDGLQQVLAPIRLQAQLYALNFNATKAEALYDQLLQLDGNDLEILQEAADFYRDNNYLQKGLTLYSRILQHPQVTALELAYTHGHIAALQTRMGNKYEALRAYLRELKAHKALPSQTKDNVFHRENLAITYAKLGKTQAALNNPKKALLFFERSSNLWESLHKANPQKAIYKKELAGIYERIGSTYASIDNFNKALAFYKEQLHLSKELSENQPNKVEYQQQLANAYEKLGDIFVSKGESSKALTFFKKQAGLFEQLRETYSNRMEVKSGLARSYAKIGAVHTQTNKNDLALTYFKQQFSLAKEFHEEYPFSGPVRNLLASAHGHLGDAYFLQGDFNKALPSFEEQNSLYGALHVANPNNASLAYKLAIAKEKLGDIHTALGDFNKALSFYSQQMGLLEELCKIYPNNLDFKDGLAISYRKSGDSFYALKNYEKALSFFRQGNSLSKELYLADLKDRDYKNNLALSYGQLGDAYNSLENLDSAMVFYIKANGLFRELNQMYAQEPEYKNNLAVSRFKAGSIYEKQAKEGLAVGFYVEAMGIWKELVADAPNNLEYRQYLAYINKKVKELRDSPLQRLRNQLQQTTDTVEIYRLHVRMTTLLRARVARNVNYMEDFSHALNNHARFALLTGKPTKARRLIKEARALPFENYQLTVNLAPALLLKGKFKAARKVYQQYKSIPYPDAGYETYGELFLDDLWDFERAGLVSPKLQDEVEEIRRLLKE
ncbi:MAG: hypothetical protein AAGI38_14585 [Bacteroidota bacterium]